VVAEPVPIEWFEPKAGERLARLDYGYDENDIPVTWLLGFSKNKVTDLHVSEYEIWLYEDAEPAYGSEFIGKFSGSMVKAGDVGAKSVKERAAIITLCCDARRSKRDASILKSGYRRRTQRAPCCNMPAQHTNIASGLGRGRLGVDDRAVAEGLIIDGETQ